MTESNKSQELRVKTTEGVTLAGRLTLPAEPAVFPVIVGVHGASGGTRDAVLLQHLQSVLPRHGIATLIFDRRGEGASTGDPLRSGFEDLAADVRSWVKFLRQHHRIDPAKIGLWSISQGGWITPLVAAADPAIACLIAISPSGLTPARQMIYAASTLLREAGYPESVISRVIGLREQIDEYCRGRGGRLEAISALIDSVRSEPWFALARLPDPADPGRAGRWRRIMDFDVTPVLRQLRVPVLLIFGERDRWVPIDASVEVWQSALGSDVDVTISRIPGAGHSPTVAVDPQDLSERGPISPVYERVLVSWLRNHC